MRYSCFYHSSLKDVKSQFLYHHLQQVPLHRFQCETENVLRQQLLLRTIDPSCRHDTTKDQKNVYFQNISSVWINAAYRLHNKGEWEKALIVAYQVKDFLNKSGECPVYERLVKKVDSLLSLTSHHKAPKDHVLRSGSDFRSFTPLSSKKTMDSALSWSGEIPTSVYFEQEKRVESIFAHQTESSMDSIVEALCLLREWEKEKCCPRDLYGSLIMEPTSSTSNYFDVLGTVKNQIYSYISERITKKILIDDSVEKIFITVLDHFPRYAAIILRDEKMIHNLFSYLKKKDDVSKENQVSPRRKTSSDFVLHLLTSLLNTISLSSVSMKGVQKQTNSNSDITEETAIIITCWRSLSVISRLLLGGTREGNGFQNIHKAPPKRLLVGHEFSIEQEIDLFHRLIVGLQSTPKQEDESALIDTKKVHRAIFTTVNILLERWVYSHDFHNDYYQSLSYTEYTKRKEKSPLTINALFLLISELNRLRINSGGVIPQALFLCYNDSFVNSNEVMNSDNLSLSGTEKNANNIMIYYIFQKPSQRWISALSMLTQKKDRPSFNTAHLRLILSGISRLRTEDNWIQALNVAAFYYNMSTSWKSSTIPRKKKEKYSSTVDRLNIDFPTQKLLLFFMKQQSWERAFDILRFTSHFNSDAIVKNNEGSPSTTTVYSPQLLRHLHFIAAVHGSWEVALQWMGFVSKQNELRSKISNEQQHRTRDGFLSGSPALNFMHHVYSLYALAAAGKIKYCESLYNSLPLPSNGAVVENDCFPVRNENMKWYDVSKPQNAITSSIVGVGLLDNEFYEEAVSFGRFARRGVSDSKLSLSSADNVVAVSIEFLGLILSHNYEGVRHWFCDVLQIPEHERNGKEGLQSLDAFEYSKEIELGSPMVFSFGVILRCCLTLHKLLGLKHLHAPFRLIIDAMLEWGCVEWDGTAPSNRKYSVTNPSKSNNESNGNHFLTTSNRRKTFVSFEHQKLQHEKLAMELSKCFQILDGDIPSWVLEESAKCFCNVGVGAYFLSQLWK